VVGLYVAPPENAIVTCVDEKPSIQELERAQGYLKLPNGRALTGPMMPQPPCGLRSNASRLCCSKFRLCWRLWSHADVFAFDAFADGRSDQNMAQSPENKWKTCPCNFAPSLMRFASQAHTKYIFRKTCPYKSTTITTRR
jgi:hypothetical protein